MDITVCYLFFNYLHEKNQKKFFQKLARIKYMPYVCIVKRAY